MRVIHNILNKCRQINIKQRLFLIYIIGGLMPLLGVSIYMSLGTKSLFIAQTRESEVAELSLISDALSENVRVIMDVSKRMYFDKELEKIAFTKYSNYSQMINDCRSYDKFEEYLAYYYQEIASITLYVNNETISNSGEFVYAEESIKQESWYQQTIQEDGRVVWSYKEDIITKKKSIRLSRVLRTEKGEFVGVLVMIMQNKRTELPITNRETETVLLLNDQVMLHSNRLDTQLEEVIKLLKEIPEGNIASYSDVTYKGKECVLSFEKVRPAYSDSYFTVLSIQPYRDILAGTNQNTRTSMLYISICVVASVILISVFSHRFGRRVITFKEEMHKAANGEFQIAGSIGGGDEISELYADLIRMIASIEELMSTLVKEQVQKEKLYARQKDVEFKMLASQINPHFMYNTLETIRMKARVNNQPDIENIVKMLAKMLRRNVEVGDRLVSLTSEINLVENYLKIQSYRFGERIHYDINVECDISNVQVIPLLLQPIVENAYVHGLEAKEGEGLLTITVKVEESLVILVNDNGVGISEEKLVEINKSLNDFEDIDKTHIGLGNVNQRIKLLYGDSYGVHISSKQFTGTTVRISLPTSNY